MVSSIDQNFGFLEDRSSHDCKIRSLLTTIMICCIDDVPEVDIGPILISPPYVARRGSIAEWRSHAKSKYDALGG
jgi:hypothetical protein